MSQYVEQTYSFSLKSILDISSIRLSAAATVTGKFYSVERTSSVDEEGTRRALQRIEDMFSRGPRDKYDAPVTSSQVFVFVLRYALILCPVFIGFFLPFFEVATRESSLYY